MELLLCILGPLTVLIYKTLDHFDLGSLEIERISIPMNELHLLVIDDALKNIWDEDLIGSVWVD